MDSGSTLSSTQTTDLFFFFVAPEMVDVERIEVRYGEPLELRLPDDVAAAAAGNNTYTLMFSPAVAAIGTATLQPARPIFRDQLLGAGNVVWGQQRVTATTPATICCRATAHTGRRCLARGGDASARRAL
ncbi:hypothetical protein U1Q18_051574 [Sarracenia purpurea var. burkii]